MTLIHTKLTLKKRTKVVFRTSESFPQQIQLPSSSRLLLFGMRFTKRDLSRLLFKNVSPLKLLLHGICIGICLLPALATLIVGLIVFVTSPSDNITTPTQCTILSKLQCVTTSATSTTTPQQTSATFTSSSSNSVRHHQSTIVNSQKLINEKSSPIECTYTVSFTIIPSQSGQQIIHASTIPFPKVSTHSNYTLNQQVSCFYDESNPKNVSFDKTNLVHFYTIVGLGVIGVGGCLLFLVLVSMTIFFTNLCRFCVGHSQMRSQRKRRLRRNLLSILIPRSSDKSSAINTEDDYEDDYQTDSSVERALDSSSTTRGILQYGAMGNRDEGNGYYYSNANKKHARFNVASSGSSNGSGISGNNSFLVHVTSSTRVKKNKSSVLIDERHFYQHSDEESEHDEKTDSSVEDIPVEILASSLNRASYPAHNL